MAVENPSHFLPLPFAPFTPTRAISGSLRSCEGPVSLHTVFSLLKCPPPQFSLITLLTQLGKLFII